MMLSIPYWELIVKDEELIGVIACAVMFTVAITLIVFGLGYFTGGCNEEINQKIREVSSQDS